MAQHEYPNIHVDDYLTLDKNSPNARYEYLEGELRMLAGASADHSTITVNLGALFLQLLSDGPWKVYDLSMALQLSRARYVYPDLTVTCDPRDQEPEDNRTHYPSVVVEVLSPGTEMVDRGKKLLYYQAHTSIKNYIMIDSQRILVEVYYREKNHWTLSTYGLKEMVPVESLAIQFSVKDAYEQTSLIRKANMSL
jgi:Uma2 family endonuclease